MYGICGSLKSWPTLKLRKNRSSENKLKMVARILAFSGKMWFGSLRLGITSKNKKGTGIWVWNRLENGSWEKFGLGNRIDFLIPPPFKTIYTKNIRWLTTLNLNDNLVPRVSLLSAPGLSSLVPGGGKKRDPGNQGWLNGVSSSFFSFLEVFRSQIKATRNFWSSIIIPCPVPLLDR